MKKYVTVFTGAGVSAESGIDTFRGADGLWEGHKVMDVASPHGFKKNPQLVWTFYRNRWLQRNTVTFNAAHKAIADLEKRVKELGFEFALITQNVDRLHQAAGSQNVIELHGNIQNVKCSECCFISEDETLWQHEIIPTCPICSALGEAKVRPDIVWFGEELPQVNIMAAYEAVEQSVAMLIVGTSNNVYPAAELPGIALSRGAHIFESNIQPAFLNLLYKPLGEELYHPLRGKATITVPVAVEQIIKLLSRSQK